MPDPTSVERSSTPWAKEFTERAAHDPAFERAPGRGLNHAR